MPGAVWDGLDNLEINDPKSDTGTVRVKSQI